jgi:predicted Zn-dependent protease
MILAAKAGYDPAALALFFEKLPGGGKSDVPSWLSTHPASQERIAEIRRLAEEIERSAR